MYDREFVDSEFKKIKDRIIAKQNDPFNPKFHISPITGWLNDPNGLCEFDGVYHIYFQYDPLNAVRKNIIWGHVTTADFINYNYHEPFIYADNNLNKNGAYSGSAFIKDGELNFFYTGNVKHPGDFDYIYEGRDHNTIKIVSKDGFNHDKHELLLSHNDYPADLSRHVRDPKVYEENGVYYLFLGARTKDDNGKVIVFKSYDLENFTYHMDIKTAYDFGYMWECPDFFEIDGEKFLMISPQGLEAEEYRYQNIYQSGYFPIEIDLASKTYELGDFVELDYGFDFYAPQTFVDTKGRTILIGWMGMPDADYTNPTVENHWQHQLTIPRELVLKDGRLKQKPLKELETLRADKIDISAGKVYKEDVYEYIAENIDGNFIIKLADDVSLAYSGNILSLAIKSSGFGRDHREVKIDNIASLKILKDKSSVEIFINDGEVVLSSRIYTDKEYLDSSVDGYIYKLKAINWSYDRYYEQTKKDEF